MRLALGPVHQMEYLELVVKPISYLNKMLPHVSMQVLGHK